MYLQEIKCQSVVIVTIINKKKTLGVSKKKKKGINLNIT